MADYLDVGDLARVNSISRHMGMEGKPPELADAVASCRSLELHSIADAILSHAGKRGGAEVLEILHVLSSRGMRKDSDALLKHALAGGGSPLAAPAP
ncbi:hypothetical protein ACWDOP_14640 [Nocardia sp. NPDC003693]